MPDMNHKTWDFTYKSDDESGEFVLYGAVFGNIDRGGDLLEKGSIQNLPELVRDGWVALNHKASELPVAMINQATQDDEGLKITGTWHGHAEATQCRMVVRERMAAGKSVKCSIGYNVPLGGESFTKINGQTVRRLEKINVYEVSFVNLPMNPAAEVVSAKSNVSQEATVIDAALDEVEAEMVRYDATLEAIKGLLGMQTKAGRKMSKAVMTKMQSYCKAMKDHSDAMDDEHKEMHAKCKSMRDKCWQHKEMAADFEKSLKELTSETGRTEDDDHLREDEEGDEEKVMSEGMDDEGGTMAKADEEVDETPGMAKPATAKGKKRRKVEDPQDSNDAAPPDKSKSLVLYPDGPATEEIREKIRLRSLQARNRINVCP